MAVKKTSVTKCRSRKTNVLSSRLNCRSLMCGWQSWAGTSNDVSVKHDCMRSTTQNVRFMFQSSKLSHCIQSLLSELYTFFYYYWCHIRALLLLEIFYICLYWGDYVFASDCLSVRRFTKIVIDNFLNDIFRRGGPWDKSDRLDVGCDRDVDLQFCFHFC